MKQYSPWKPPSIEQVEKNSIRELMDKMGMSKEEIQVVRNNYGVSASQLLQLMQMSKYQFVYPGRVPGQCDPCRSLGHTKPK